MTLPQSPHAQTPIRVEISRDLEDIVPTFLENRGKDLQTLHVAVVSQDFSTLQTLGHRMKGDGGGYGFDAISTIGARLETAAKQQDLPVSKHLIAELEDFLNRVTVLYR
ncbi:MAG TPA: Hpt domain-containing protein [Nitrospira sp.]|nr:Hpt domain-containing protein [Nitrospira sp.]